MGIASYNKRLFWRAKKITRIVWSGCKVWIAEIIREWRVREKHEQEAMNDFESLIKNTSKLMMDFNWKVNQKGKEQKKS